MVKNKAQETYSRTTVFKRIKESLTVKLHTMGKTKTVFFIISLSLTVFLVYFIITNSLATGTQSSHNSSKIASFVVNVADKLNIDVSNVNIESTLRDVAHFTEFALFSLFLTCCFEFSLFRFKSFAPYAFLISLMLAVTDERVQLSVEGRASEVADVITDFCGSVIAILVTATVFKIIRHFSSKRKAR